MIIIFHNRDLDGYCSGAICKKKYPEATLIGYDYGQDFPWDKMIQDEPVIMVDVSLPMVDMEKLAHISGDLTWIDHHVSAIKAFNEYDWFHQESGPQYVTAVLEDGIAACEIAWKHLFPSLSIPEAVSLLGKYDTWREFGTDVWNYEILPFQYGMRLQCQSPEDFNPRLLEPDKDNFVHQIVLVGSGILKYQRQQDKLAMHGAFECEFQGYKAIMCNIRGAGSLAFDSVLKPEHQLMVGFGYTGRQWSFSLRTDKDDVDVSMIAKQFGGGGHKAAAGFAVDNLEDVIDLKLWKRVKTQI